MTATGQEVLAAAKLISPLINGLYAGAKDAVKTRLRNWASGQFSEEIVKRISMVERVKTLWQMEKEVSIRDFYYPMSLIEEGKQPHPIASLRDLESNHCVIQGIVGQGKSIFLRHLCVSELSQGRVNRLPLFIELRTIVKDQSLKERICEELNAYGADINNETFDYLCEKGKLSLLLDGYDELDSSFNTAIFFEISRLSNSFPKIQIIVSSRPDHEVQNIPGFPVFRLAPLNSTSHLPFLERLGVERLRAIDIARAIAESPTEISSIMTTPLMLTLAVIVYTFESEIPPELDDFFEALFTTVVTRHDKSKPGLKRKFASGLGERSLRKLFEAFCFMAAQMGQTRTLTTEQFGNALEKACKYSDGAVCSVEDFWSDVCRIACLMQEEGLQNVSFIHKSIPDYFAASFIRRQQQPAADRFYTSARQDEGRWKGILYFLAKIDSYRYNSLYLIPLIEAAMREIEVDLQNPTDIAILGRLQLLSEQIDVLARATDLRMTVTIALRNGESVLGENPIVKSINDEVLRVLKQELPDDISILEGGVRHQSIRANSEDSLELPGPLAFAYVGNAPLIRAYKYAVSQVRTQYEDAHRYNSAEDKKQDIF